MTANFTRVFLGFGMALAMLWAGVQPTIGEEAENGKDKAEKWSVEAPPGDSREIDIDVTEGTWMNVDVSPDGKTVLFDLLGDIYSMPIDGGEATAITSGLAWDYHPRFSPDGSRIAFTSDRSGGDNIWVMAADGSEPIAVTKESFQLINNPTWSPDGQYIAARKHFTTRRSLGTGEIWVYYVGGGAGVAAFERPNPQHQKDIGEPMYTPDGSAIYFSMNTTPGSTFIYAQDSNTELFRIRKVDLTSGEVEDVVSGPGGAVRPTPSPDGRYMAYVKRVRAKSSLFLKDLNSGQERMIYRDLDQDNQETWSVWGVYPNMDWTPDSRSIVFYARGKIRRIDVASGEVTEIPFHVADTRTVYDPPRPQRETAPDAFKTQMTRWGQLSPDGKTLLFESLGRIYTRDVTSGETRRLTRDGDDHFEYYPSYSRDGRWVVFVSWDDDKLGAVRKVRARGGRSEVLTGEPGHYIAPRLSPDNKTVVYQKAGGGYLTSGDWSEGQGIWRIPADGGASTQIEKSGSAPHFGASSDRVFFERFEDDKHKLYSADMDGEDERVHATATFSRRMAISPDENYLAFREGYHVHLTPLPKAGKPIAVSPRGGATPTVRLSRDGGNFMKWSADGQSISFSTGPTLYTVAVADALAKQLGTSDEDFEQPDSGFDMSMTVTADKPSGLVALTGARIISMMPGENHVIEQGTIVIEGNRIAAVGPVGTVEVPDGAKVMDVTGKTIIPGLIDTHAHGAHAANGMNPQQNWAQYATLALGVTTVHDPSHSAADIFSAAEMQRAGRIVGPRIFSTGDIVYGAKAEYWAPIDSYEDALAHVRRLKAQGAMSIKNYNQPRRDQRQQVVAAARAENMLVVPEGGSGFYLDMSMIADGNSSIEHALPNQAVYEDVLQFWSATDVAFNHTLLVGYGGIWGEDYMYQKSDVWRHPLISRLVPPHILQPRSVRRQMAPDEDYGHFGNGKISKQLLDRGVTVLNGAHGQREGLGTHWEMWLFADGGATAMDALHASTILPARHLGMEADIGSLEVGKLADLAILDVNPLEDLRSSDQVSYVMVNGRLYESATMNEVLTGEHKTRPFYWWGKPESDIR